MDDSSTINQDNRGTKRRSSEFLTSDHCTITDTADTAASNNTTSDCDSSGPYHCLPIHGEHKRAVSCLSFAPSTAASTTVASTSCIDKVVCASASADGSVRLWDISTHLDTCTTTNNDSSTSNKSNLLLPVATITGHTRGINDLAWSPRASNLIATASDDKTLKIWDVTRSPASSHTSSFASANANGNTNDNSVGMPSVGTGSTSPSNDNNCNSTGDSITDALVEFKGHSNFCFSVKFNPQGNLLVSGSFDETVKVWDVRTGECVSTLPAHSDPVTGVDFNRDGTCIVSSSHDGLMRIWDVATGECLKTIYAEGNPPVTFVKYSANGKYVLSGMLDGKLRLWNVMGGRDTSIMPTANSSKDYLNIGLSSAQGRGGQCTKTYAGHRNSKYCIFSAFSVANPIRQSIVTGSEDGKVHVYDLQTRNTRQVLDGHKDACLAVATHDTKEIIASGGMSNDRLVKFWVPK